jgi:hypothetical protein
MALEEKAEAADLAEEAADSEADSEEVLVQEK